MITYCNCLRTVAGNRTGPTYTQMHQEQIGNRPTNPAPVALSGLGKKPTQWTSETPNGPAWTRLAKLDTRSFGT